MASIRELGLEAYHCGSHDNITVTVVWLKESVTIPAAILDSLKNLQVKEKSS